MRRMLLLLGLGLAAPALAIPVPAGDFSVTPTGSTLGTAPAQLIGEQSFPFSTGGARADLSGAVVMRVRRSALRGEMIYSWQVTVAKYALGSVSALRVVGMPDQPYDLNWRNDDGAGLYAPSAVQAATPPGSPRVLVFQFSPAIRYYSQSHELFVKVRDGQPLPPTLTFRIRPAAAGQPDLVVPVTLPIAPPPGPYTGPN